MKVLSLNCNKFGGKTSNGRGKIYNNLVVEKLIAITKFFLDTDDENVVFFNEINNANDNMKKFEELFDDNVYTIHRPTRFDEFNKNNHPYGCTIAITKNNLFWEKSYSIDLIESKSKEVSFANKSVILKHKDTILVGIHMPYDLCYWDELLNYFSANINKKIYIIGDLNVYDEETDRKMKFNELKNRGAIDVWVNIGNEDQHITCITDKGRRLDYVLTSTIGYMSIKKMSYIDSFRLSELSDHSGIFIEL